MLQFWLPRTEESEHGTFGHLICLDKHWFTAELPWVNNQTNLSCIPTGIYLCIYKPEGKYKGYELQNVRDRTNIEMHPLNFVYDRRAENRKSDAKGCIGIGKGRGEMIPPQKGDTKYTHPQECIFSSRKAFEELLEFTNKEDFTLHIEHKIVEG